MKKRLNRWVYAVVGTIVLLFAGIIYAWTILSLPIVQDFPEWTKLQQSAVFTAAMSAFCLSGLCGGIMQSRGVDVRLNMALSALLTLAGFLLSAGVKAPGLLLPFFGVLVGLGSGFSYNAVLSTMSKWFPDKQGLISGVLLMGFGLGSFLIGKIYQGVTPGLAGGWRTAFRFLGLCIFALNSLSIPFFVKPEGNAAAKAASEEREEFTPGQMLKSSSFYLYFLWSVLLSACGLVLVSQASGIVREVSPSVSAGLSATVVGLISVCNGGGRVLFGLFYDKKGYRPTMGLVVLGFVATAGILIAAIATEQFALVVLGFLLGGFSYGGVTPTNSALTSDFFGPKHYAVNFSLVGTALIVASFASSVAGALYDASGSYFSSMLMIVIAAALGFVCLLVMRSPREKTKRRLSDD